MHLDDKKLKISTIFIIGTFIFISFNICTNFYRPSVRGLNFTPLQYI